MNASGGYSNTGHTPHLELYHLIFFSHEACVSVYWTSGQERKKKKVHCWLFAQEWGLSRKDASREKYVFVGGNFSFFVF